MREPDRPLACDQPPCEVVWRGAAPASGVQGTNPVAAARSRTQPAGHRHRRVQGTNPAAAARSRTQPAGYRHRRVQGTTLPQAAQAIATML